MAEYTPAPQTNRAAFVALLAAATCLVSIETLVFFTGNAVLDTIGQTVVFQTTPVSQWWIVPAMEAIAFVVAIVANLVYWSYEDLIEGFRCPTKRIASPGWVIAGVLATQFPNNPYVTALTIVSFVILFVFGYIAVRLDGGRRRAASIIGILLAIFVPLTLAVYPSIFPVFETFVALVGQDAFVLMFTSIATGIVLVPAIALINQNLVAGLAFQALGPAIRELENIPNDVFDAQREDPRIVVTSVGLGFLVNVLFTWIVLGDALYLAPGLTAAELSAAITPGTAAIALLSVVLAFIGFVSILFRPPE